MKWMIFPVLAVFAAFLMVGCCSTKTMTNLSEAQLNKSFGDVEQSEGRRPNGNFNKREDYLALIQISSQNVKADPKKGYPILVVNGTLAEDVTVSLRKSSQVCFVDWFFINPIVLEVNFHGMGSKEDSLMPGMYWATYHFNDGSQFSEKWEVTSAPHWDAKTEKSYGCVIQVPCWSDYRYHYRYHHYNHRSSYQRPLRPYFK